LDKTKILTKIKTTFGELGLSKNAELPLHLFSYFPAILWDRNELTQFRCDGLPFREFVTPWVMVKNLAKHEEVGEVGLTLGHGDVGRRFRRKVSLQRLAESGEPFQNLVVADSDGDRSFRSYEVNLFFPSSNPRVE
jgi:hypothetical protein